MQNDNTGASFDLSYLAENLAGVQSRIKNAIEISGRRDTVKLLAAVKYASCEEIDELFRLGVTDMGENRVNTFLEHYYGVKENEIEWHFIGSLQKNKVKYLVGKIACLHSLDSLSLAEEIEKRYARADLILDCLVEINIGEEESKGGVSPDVLSAFVAALSDYPHIKIKGFMTMAPATASEEEFLGYFRHAVELGRNAWKNTLKLEGEPLFSIGMSRTLEPAIAAGSNIVRIGGDLFGHK